MPEPEWLTTRDLLAIHDEQLREHGGPSGVRDRGLLESAVARPQQHAAYGDPDIPELGALYAIAIAKNHPFIDGNKRTAFIALAVFLRLNGYALVSSEAANLTAMLALAAGDATDEEFIAWVRASTAPSPN